MLVFLHRSLDASETHASTDRVHMPLSVLRDAD